MICAPQSVLVPPASYWKICEFQSARIECGAPVDNARSEPRASWFPAVPEDTKRAAGLAKMVARWDWRELVVVDSWKTSSPRLESVRREESWWRVGVVRVSERKSWEAGEVRNGELEGTVSDVAAEEDMARTGREWNWRRGMDRGVRGRMRSVRNMVELGIVGQMVGKWGCEGCRMRHARTTLWKIGGDDIRFSHSLQIFANLTIPSPPQSQLLYTSLKVIPLCIPRRTYDVLKYYISSPGSNCVLDYSHYSTCTDRNCQTTKFIAYLKYWSYCRVNRWRGLI